MKNQDENQKVYCDDCGKVFAIKVRTRKVKDDVKKVYFRCPKCKREYVAYYINNEIEKKQREFQEVQHQLINLKGGNAAELINKSNNLRKEIGNLVDALKAEMKQK